MTCEICGLDITGVTQSAIRDAQIANRTLEEKLAEREALVNECNRVIRQYDERLKKARCTAQTAIGIASGLPIDAQVLFEVLPDIRLTAREPIESPEDCRVFRLGRGDGVIFLTEVLKSTEKKG